MSCSAFRSEFFLERRFSLSLLNKGNLLFLSPELELWDRVLGEGLGDGDDPCLISAALMSRWENQSIHRYVYTVSLFIMYSEGLWCVGCSCHLHGSRPRYTCVRCFSGRIQYPRPLDRVSTVQPVSIHHCDARIRLSGSSLGVKFTGRSVLD